MIKTYVTLMVCFFLAFAFKLSASEKCKPQFSEQTLADEKIIISYAQPFTYSLNENTSWLIVSATNQKTISSGTGSINEFKFKQPGNYVVEITDKTTHNINDCNHAHFPARLNVEVSNMEMTFDFNSIRFSQEIIGGQDAQNIELSVNVNYNHFENKTTEFSNQIISAGVNAKIVGTSKSVQLVPGTNKIVYQLKGSAAKNTYIMFDFIDVNGQTQTYYLTTKLN